MAPRVSIVTPFAFPSPRGNAVTVERVARGLADRGVDVRVWDLSAVPEAAVEERARDFAPALVHAFHAYRVGPLALRLARRADIPVVVTMTGTDANLDLVDPERSAVVRRVLERAAAVTVFDPSIGARLARALPGIESRIVEMCS